MAAFRLHCGTCSFECETTTLEDALLIEADHKDEHGSAHEVTIERLRES